MYISRIPEVVTPSNRGHKPSHLNANLQMGIKTLIISTLGRGSTFHKILRCVIFLISPSTAMAPLVATTLPPLQQAAGEWLGHAAPPEASKWSWDNSPRTDPRFIGSKYSQ
jgi:hypothetical protein